MAVDNVETRCLIVGQQLYNIEHGIRTIVRRIEKLSTKLVLKSSAVLFNQFYIDEKLLPNYTNLRLFWD